MASYVYTEVVKNDCYNMINLGDNNYDDIIDIGANIGIFSMWANEIYPNAKIKCFEPVPSTFNDLKENMDNNKNKKFEVFNYGIGKKTEQCRIYSRRQDFSPDFRVGIFEDEIFINNYETAQLYSVDDFLSKLKVNYNTLLKIDCEGGEFAFFETQKGIDFLKSVKTVIMEVHCWDDTKANVIKKVHNIFGNNIIISKGMKTTFMVTINN